MSIINLIIIIIQNMPINDDDDNDDPPSPLEPISHITFGFPRNPPSIEQWSITQLWPPDHLCLYTI